MYSDATKRATVKYQAKFKRVQLLVPQDVNAAIEVNEPNKQGYILGLIKADLKERGLLRDSE